MGGPLIKSYGMAKLFEEKVKEFSDFLLKMQLDVYEKITGGNSPEDQKQRYEILKAEAKKRGLN